MPPAVSLNESFAIVPRVVVHDTEVIVVLDSSLSGIPIAAVIGWFVSMIAVGSVLILTVGITLIRIVFVSWSCVLYVSLTVTRII